MLSLYEPKRLKGNYVALSYCWGNGQSLVKTTASTIVGFNRHIPWQMLPQTLQDAILITRRLGLQYIWIDCLCIIQDSTSDWEYEAGKMGSYYSNAFITIAATASTDAGYGVYHRRSEVSSQQKINFRGPDCNLHEVSFQSRGSTEWDFVVYEFGPLGRRGWTFQEHALSTRILHFTNSEMIWECRAETRSEDGHPLMDNSASLIRELRGRAAGDPGNSWRFLVQAYTRRKLTFASDKLPAISGVAHIIQQRTGHRYVAGLWEESLVFDLTWCMAVWVTGENDLKTPPKMVGGPSWSWSSIDGAVSFALSQILEDGQLDVIKTLSDIKAISCSSPGLNPFGQIHSGTLEIEGPALEVTLEYDGSSDVYDKRSYSFTVHCPSYSNIFFTPDTALRKVTTGPSSTTLERCSTIPTAFKEQVWCLWCFCVEDASEDSSESTDGIDALINFFGVALAKGRPGEAKFHRIGHVTTTETSSDSETPSKLLGLCTSTRLAIE